MLTVFSYYSQKIGFVTVILYSVLLIPDNSISLLNQAIVLHDTSSPKAATRIRSVPESFMYHS